MSSPPRVLLADDHPPMRAGVRIALERDGIVVCAEVATAADAVDAALREKPDACLLDVRMPGGGTSAASMITSHLPNTKVIMLTVSSEEEDLFESLRRGAVGYLLKDMDPAELPGAVRATLEGDARLPGALTARLIDEFRRPRAQPFGVQARGRAELSRREWEVLELLAGGLTTGGIASRLFLSQVTVRRHVSNIVRKLGVSSRDEAVQVALGDRASTGAANRRTAANHGSP